MSQILIQRDEQISKLTLLVKPEVGELLDVKEGNIEAVKGEPIEPGIYQIVEEIPLEDAVTQGMIFQIEKL